MSIVRQFGRSLKQIVYGDSSIPHEFTITLKQPQSEIAVHFECRGASVDVTNRHTIACCAPFIIAVSIDAVLRPAVLKAGNASLLFRERAYPHRVLGVIRLAPGESISLDSSTLVLFEVLGSTNYCLPRLRLWAHYLPEAVSNWRKLPTFDVKMTHREIRASQVAFIRPHPLMLGSLNDRAGGNIFPMNLMGDLGDGQFAFALKDSRRVAHAVERTGCIALSNIPSFLCSVAFQLAINHKREAAEWNQLPFALHRSRELRIPVPACAPRVRELKVEQIHRVGSHTLFIARILSDDWRSDEPPVHIIHGFYQHWRLKGDKVQLKSSVVEDALNKRGATVS